MTNHPLENFVESAERNKGPILDKLKFHLAGAHSVLEIGSGSGQHVLYFAERLPDIFWQPTETADNLVALRNNISRFAPENVRLPLLLEVRSQTWPVSRADNIFSANILHILPWSAVEDFYAGVGRILDAGGLLFVYGAMRYKDAFSGESDARFDARLKKQDPARGIRDFEAIARLADAQSLHLLADYSMPSNNRLLVWQSRRRN